LADNLYRKVIDANFLMKDTGCLEKTEKGKQRSKGTRAEERVE
jgi:hypothetical protein